MINGFTFKNRHSSEFGIISKTKTFAMVPQAKIYAYSPALSDGSTDFSKCNPYGREFYNDRSAQLELQIAASGFDALKARAAKIAAWLHGSGDLIFDSSNSTVWKARLASDISFSPERRGQKAVLGALFTIYGMGRASFDMGEGIYLRDGIMIGADIAPASCKYYRNIQLKKGNNSLKFLNIGDFYAHPVFKISGAGMAVISNGKKSLTAVGDEVIELDFARHYAKDKNGESIMSNVSGEFFEFEPGITQYSVYVDADAVMDISCVPQCMYDFDFSDIDWEGAYAQTV